MEELYKLLYKNVLFRGYHAVKRDGYISAERRARIVESLSAAELEAYSKEKLRKLLRFSFDNVPYYRDALAKGGYSASSEISADTLYSLPVISKMDIKNNYKLFQSKCLKGNKLFPNSTSGSSGETLIFNTDQRSYAYRSALVERNHRWAGVERGDKEARLWGAPMDISKSDTFRGKLHSAITRKVMLSAYCMTEQNLSHYLRLLEKFKPKLLTSYPGPLEVLAKYCKEHNKKISSLKSIITSAETLYPHQRELIEGVFGVNVYDRYGSREFGTIAQEDKIRRGLSVNSDHVFVEILGEDGKECGPHEVGELVITDLDNYGMPLIRYRIGDRASWSADYGSYSHIPFPRINKIEGRTMDVIFAPNGSYVGGTYWTILMRSKGNVEKFQIVQESEKLLRILYESNRPFSGEEERYFRDKIASTCGSGLKVRFQKVSRIEPTKSGKHRIIVSYNRR